MKNSCLPFLLLMMLSAALSAQQLAPSIVWQKCLGGSGTDLASAVLRTADNGLLVVGSSKSNDGDMTGHHGSVDSTDALVMKLSASGKIIWQRSLGGSGTDVFNSVIATSDGNYLCMGTTTSNDGDVSGLHGRADIWVVKIDRNGNIIWKKCYGGSLNEIAGSLKQNKDGSIYFIGSAFSIDGDVSGNHNVAPYYYYSDIWILRLDKDGTIISQKCLGGSNTDEGYDIVETESGNYIIACKVMSQDSQFGHYTIDPFGLIAKMDLNGVLIWLYRPLRQQPVQITSPSDNEYLVSYVDWSKVCPANPNFGAGIFSFSYSSTSTSPPSITGGAGFRYCNNYNPVGGYSTSPSSLGSSKAMNLLALATDDTLDNNVFHRGSTNGFIAGIGTNAITVGWKKLLGGSSRDVFVSVIPVNDYEMIAAGHTGSNDGDVSGNHGGTDIWLVKLGQVNYIKGTVFLDYNVNGNKEGNEPFLDNIVVQSHKGGIKDGSSTYKGIFSNSVDTGTYISNVITPIPYYSAVPATKISVFNAYNTYDSLSFALQPIPGKKDYLINLFGTGPLRPGFNTQYKIRYLNAGTDTLINKTVRMIKDSRLQFISSVPAQTSISGDTITWLINNLSPRDTGFISLLLKAAAPPALNYGDIVTNNVLIDSTGDLAPLDNFASLLQLASGAFDPNDKQEMAGGAMTTREIADNKYLQYTIRFQNTGNDTAFNIAVRDTLSAKTDWASLEMVAASHPYKLTINNGNQLAWTFTDILLVDSVHNEPASHGYIVYRIKPQTVLQQGDTIINAAAIYFDFNPPVNTNKQLTIVKQAIPAPATPVVTGIQTGYCSIKGVQKGKIANLPPAGGGTTTTVQLDAAVLPVAADSSFGFNVSAMAAGAHVLVITFTNNSGSKATTIHFSIVHAVTPAVQLSASTSNVTNLTDPVVITAANAAGGGISPTFSFAKDRAFSNILQAESSSNILTIQPNTLTVGGNWVYAKMKTSDTCYSAQTGIDSIKIERSAVTGLFDIDFPGQLINIYPNPFSNNIQVTGLNAGKTYSITISNAAGQSVHWQQVSNSSRVTITKNGLQTGKYWLSMYDYKKHLLIGTIALIKE